MAKDITDLNIDNMLNNIESKLAPIGNPDLDCDHKFTGQIKDMERGYRCSKCRRSAVEIIKMERELRHRELNKREKIITRITLERDEWRKKHHAMADKFKPILNKLSDTTNMIVKIRKQAITLVEEVNEKSREIGDIPVVKTSTYFAMIEKFQKFRDKINV